MPYPDLVRHRMTQTPRRFRLNCCTHRQVCLLWSRLSTCREQTMTLQAKAIRSMLGETEWVRQRKSEYECEFRGHGGILYTTHTHTQTYQGRPAKSRSKIEVTDSGSRSHASQVALQLSRYHSCAHAHSHTHRNTFPSLPSLLPVFFSFLSHPYFHFHLSTPAHLTEAS